MLHESILLVRDENAFGAISHELKLNFNQVNVSIRGTRDFPSKNDTSFQIARPLRPSVGYYFS